MPKLETIGTLTVRGLYRRASKEDAATPVQALGMFCEGIEGDHHFGFTKGADVRQKPLYQKGQLIRNNRQWSAVSVEELAEIAKEAGASQEIDPAWFGINICFSGIERFSKLPPLTILRFPSGLVLMVYEENTPCVWIKDSILRADAGLDARQAATVAGKAAGRRGLVGWIDRPGTARVGDVVEVLRLV